jgi:hypothetical protein
VVDDNVDAAETMVMLLEFSGHEVKQGLRRPGGSRELLAPSAHMSCCWTSTYRE